MMTTIIRQPRTRRGQALVEYTLILALASIVAIGSMDFLRVWLTETLEYIEQSLF